MKRYQFAKVIYNEMWFDGCGWSSNQSYPMGEISVLITDNDKKIIKALRKAGYIAKGKHYHTDYASENSILVENNSGSEMLEIVF